MKNKKMPKIILLLAIMLGISIIIVNILNNTSNQNTKAERFRTLTYIDVENGDESIFDEQGNVITAVKFDAFFLKDKDGDGVAESIRGTCNEIGTTANIYMDLRMVEEGT